MNNLKKILGLKEKLENDTICEKLPFKKVNPNGKGWASFDIEAHVYYKGKRIESQEELDKLTLKEHLNNSFFDNFEIKPWAFMLYDELNGFRMFKNVDDFINHCFEYNIKFLWDFNLKYDGFALLESLLNKKNGYKIKKFKDITQEEIENDKNLLGYHMSIDNQNFYNMTINDLHSKKIEHGKYKYDRIIDIYDFSNIQRTKLKDIAEAFELNERKGTLDYFKTDFNNLTDKDIEYCLNDCVILYKAVLKSEEILKKLVNDFNLKTNPTDLTLTGSGKKFQTSASIASTFFLWFLYPEHQRHDLRLKWFKYNHPVNSTVDRHFRKHGLYSGGISVINPDFKGKFIDQSIIAGDVISMYPYIMENLNDLEGFPKAMNWKEYENKKDDFKDYEVFYLIKSATFKIRENCFPVFKYDKKYSDFFKIKDFWILKDELENLHNWYIIEDLEIDLVYLYKKGKKIFKKFVSTFFKLKQQHKKEDKKALYLFDKIMLNSVYGKMGQKIEREVYLIDENKQGLKLKIKKDEYDDIILQVNPALAFSLPLASLITARARIYLRDLMMKVGNNNPKKNIIYCDTDSIFTINTDFHFSNKKTLGTLKQEHDAQGGIFLKPKTYALYKDSLNEGKNFLITSGIFKEKIIKKMENYNKEELINAFKYNAYFHAKTSKLIKGGRLIFNRFKKLASSEENDD